MATGKPTILTFLQQSEVFAARSKNFYHPLDPSRNEIRVFHVLPGAWGDVIQLQLEAVSLDDDPQYEAVSYTWEDMTKTKPIMLEDVAYNVTYNQEALLRRFRLPDAKRTLWMDVISINQADPVEKGQQVSMMSKIYGFAATSRIWLGEPTADWIGTISVEQATAFMSGALSPDLHSPQVPLEPEVPAGPRHKYLTTPVNNLDAIDNAFEILRELAQDQHFQDLPCWGRGLNGTDTYMPPVWQIAVETMMNVLERPWWTRVWVIQETILPKTWPSIQAGPYELSFEDLVAASRAWKRHSKGCCGEDQDVFNRPEQIARFMDSIDRVGKLRDAYERYPVQLQQALGIASSRNATDPRDYVYGVLSMAQEGEADIPVNYRYSLGTVYAYASFAVLQIQKSLGLLTMGFGKRSDFQADAIPSWAQDWSTPTNTRMRICHRHLMREKRAAALPSWNDIYITPESLTLTTPANLLGTVEKIAATSSRRQSDRRKAKERRTKLLEEWWDFVELACPRTTPEQFVDIVFTDKDMKPPVVPKEDKNAAYEFTACTLEGGSCMCSSMVNHMNLDDFLDDVADGLLPFSTCEEDMGMGPLDMQVGDEIFGIFGCPPMVLRRVAVEGDVSSEMSNAAKTYNLIGACVVSGSARQKLDLTAFETSVAIQ